MILVESRIFCKKEYSTISIYLRCSLLINYQTACSNRSSGVLVKLLLQTVKLQKELMLRYLLLLNQNKKLHQFDLNNNK